MLLTSEVVIESFTDLPLGCPMHQVTYVHVYRYRTYSTNHGVTYDVIKKETYDGRPFFVHSTASSTVRYEHGYEITVVAFKPSHHRTIANAEC